MPPGWKPGDPLPAFPAGFELPSGVPDMPPGWKPGDPLPGMPLLSPSRSSRRAAGPASTSGPTAMDFDEEGRQAERAVPAVQPAPVRPDLLSFILNPGLEVADDYSSSDDDDSDDGDY